VEGFCYGRRNKVLVLLHQVEIEGFIGDSQYTLSFGSEMAAKHLERDERGATSQAIVKLAVCLSDCRLQQIATLKKRNENATNATPKKRGKLWRKPQKTSDLKT